MAEVSCKKKNHDKYPRKKVRASIRDTSCSEDLRIMGEKAGEQQMEALDRYGSLKGTSGLCRQWIKELWTTGGELM